MTSLVPSRIVEIDARIATCEDLRMPDLDRPTAIRRIRIVRGERVIIDSDLAQLYGVATKVLLQAVRTQQSPISRRLHVPTDAL